MPSIVKASAVVDDRERQSGPVITGLFDQQNAVIKGRVLSGAIPWPRQGDWVGDPLDGNEQLKRIRAQIADAKEDLRKMNSRLARVREEVDELRREQELLESVREIGADEKVRQMLTDAEKQAKFLRDRAMRESEEASAEMRSRGYIEGLQQGKDEALDAFRAEHQADTDKLTAMLEGASALYTDQVKANESNLVSLAVSVAGKIIGRTLEEKPETIVDMLREIVEDNRREEFIKITISADLMPAEAKVRESIRKSVMEMGQRIDVRVETAEPGTLLVETPKGFADLSVDTQLANMEASLLESLSEED